jgi:perosamine synthetase
MYAILLDHSFPLSRDVFRVALKERGIDTRDFFYPLHQMPLAQPFVSAGTQFPAADDIALRGCYLPSGLAITDAQIDTVVDAVRDLARGG